MTRDSEAVPLPGGGSRWVAFSRRLGGVLAMLAVPALNLADEPPLLDSTSVYAERSSHIVFERAVRFLNSGQTTDGIAALQGLLDAPQDTFVAQPGSARGLRAAASEILKNAPAATRRLYAMAQETRAATALAQAVSDRDRRLLGEVTRRFPTTESAGKALNRLARSAFDRGEFGTAARLWSMVLSEQLETGDVSPELVAHTIISLRRSGREARASQLSHQFGETTVLIGGKPTAIGSLVPATASERPALPTTSSAASAGAGLTPPAFPPVWQHATGTGTPAFLELWSAARQSEGRPVATPAAALVSGGRLFVREPAALVAYDRHTGRPVWRSSLEGSSAPHPADSHFPALHELTRFEEYFASNGTLASISTDGDRVYVIDRSLAREKPIRTASHSPPSGSDRRSGSSETNRLLAFSTLPDSHDNPRPVWIAGGHPVTGKNQLAGHRFLGSPVATQGRLLAITELRQALYLVVLDASNGELLWSQPLGYVARPAEDDLLRAAGSCSPAVADGIAVCTTNAGFLVSVDIVTCRLLWAYEYGGAFGDERIGATGKTVHLGDPSIPSEPLIRDGKVVILPQDSSSVHCLDLATGEPLWTVPRDEALALACLTDNAAIVLGRASLRSLSMTDGTPNWTTRPGATAGAGIATASTYLLPLESGTIAAVDLDSGHRAGFDTARRASDYRPLDKRTFGVDDRPRWRPGNLFTDGESLFSVGAMGVMRLETASAALAGIDPSVSPLASARLALAAGRLDVAQATLQAALKNNSDDSAREAGLLRELLFLKLQNDPADERQSIVATLDELSTTPANRGRFLLEATAEAIASGETAALPQRMSELAAVNYDRPLALPHDATHLISAAGWLHELTARLPEKNGTDRKDAASRSLATVDELERQLLCLPDGDRADRLRIELARRLTADSEFHRAEMHLLQVAASNAREPAVLASLDRLRESSGRGGSKDTTPATDLAIENVQIKGRLWSPADRDLCRTFGELRRYCQSRGRNPFRLVDVGDTRQAKLAIIDLKRGLRFGQIGVDARLRFPAIERQPLDSHFVPVATADHIYGLSFLEARSGQPVWTADLPGNGSQLPHIGPYGASYCTVQTRQELTVLDPATGKPLWRRTSLPVQDRFPGSRSNEVFGDDKALVLLDAEDGRYAVYRTQTGCELNRGRLTPTSMRHLRICGRKLFSIEQSDDRLVARLWDPLAEDRDLEFDFTGSLLETKTRDGLLVLLFRDGRLIVVDPKASRVAVRINIDPAIAAQVRGVQAFSDTDRHYVSLYLPEPDRVDDGVRVKHVYDTPLTTTHVRGLLVAIDRRRGTPAWSRPVDRRTILDPIDHPFPFLVALSQVDDRRESRRRTLLVEAIDPATGAVLGRNENLISDQLLQAGFDAENDRVSLAGMTSTIELEIEREESRRSLGVASRGKMTGDLATGPVDR